MAMRQNDINYAKISNKWGVIAALLPSIAMLSSLKPLTPISGFMRTTLTPSKIDKLISTATA